MLIIQGNRFGGRLGIHVGNDCLASGEAHATSLIQPQGTKIHPSFVEAISNTSTSWGLYRHDADRENLGLMLGLSTEDVARLRSFPLFGTIRCTDGPSKKLPWALEAVCRQRSAGAANGGASSLCAPR